MPTIIQSKMMQPTIIFLTLLFLSPSINAQGLLMPSDRDDHFVLPRHGRRIAPNQTTYQIEKISVDAQIDGQIAKTAVSQTFRNTGYRDIQVSFVFPLPYDGAVDRLTFLVDGKELEAKLMNADKARNIYQGYVRRKQDPALLEWVGTGMFKTSIFPIPAGKSRTVTLQYSQLLRKEGKTVDFLFPLATAQYTSKPISELSVRVSINSNQDLKNIYSPTHDVKIKRDDERNAVVKFKATDSIPNSDFRLVYGTDTRDIGANVISYWPKDEDQGYFLLLASPKIKTNKQSQQSKNVVFVVDRSGSMNGKKMDQARDAAKYVMNNLNDGDLFNIIAYDSDVESFVPELERYAAETRPGGIGFINSIHSGGSTNIDGALKTAFASITNSSRPSYVVFLTDGLPTAGETNEMQIVANSEKRNLHRSRLITFGVGYDVNSRLIDRLTRKNHGQSEFVKPNEDIEAAVSRLYKKISAPVMTDIKVDYEFDKARTEMGNITNRVYPSDEFDLFAGQQLVLVGRYQQGGAAKIRLRGSVNGEKTKFKFNVKFAKKGKGTSNKYVEKLWATRRIGEIIDLVDLEGQNKELMNELLSLSKKHGILTPYTAFLADENETARRFALGEDHFGITRQRLSRLNTTGGQQGFSQRLAKGRMKSAEKLQLAARQLAEIEDSFGAAPLPPSGGGAGGGGLGGGGGRRGGIATKSKDAKRHSGLRRVGLQTLYLKEKTLIAENALDVDTEKSKSQIVELKRFSDAYFALIKDNTEEENKLMSAQQDGEELLIRLRGKIYRIK